MVWTPWNVVGYTWKKQNPHSSIKVTIRNTECKLIDLFSVDLIWREFVSWQVVSSMKNEQQSQNLLLKVVPLFTFRKNFLQPATSWSHKVKKNSKHGPITCKETMLRDKLEISASRISLPLGRGLHSCILQFRGKLFLYIEPLHSKIWLHGV